MKIEDMMTLYEYNYWATRQVLATSAKVSLEQSVSGVAAFAFVDGGEFTIHIRCFAPGVRRSGGPGDRERERGVACVSGAPRHDGPH